MRRVIVFLGVAAVTFYLAMIYKSGAFIFLGFAELIITALSLLYCFLGLFKIRVSIEAPVNITELRQEIPIRIIIKNYGIFPTGKLGILLEESHALFRKKRAVFFYAAAEGKEHNKNSRTVVIDTQWHSEYMGKAVIRIKRVNCFGLFGILALPLPKKRCKGREEIVILPPFYEVPVEVGNTAREFMAEQERYVQSSTEDVDTEQFQIRNYQPGDRIRSIHWKLSAKNDELVVRDYKTVVSCPVLFFLNLSEEKKGSRRSVLRRREDIFIVLLSISSSLLQERCSHYVIWYDSEVQDVVRHRMEREEDLYMLLMKMTKLEFCPKEYSLKEAYNLKYHEKAYADELTLDWNLRLFCNDENVIRYDAGNLKKSLTSQEIFFA